MNKQLSKTNKWKMITIKRRSIKAKLKLNKILHYNTRETCNNINCRRTIKREQIRKMPTTKDRITKPTKKRTSQTKGLLEMKKLAKRTRLHSQRSKC